VFIEICIKRLVGRSSIWVTEMSHHFYRNLVEVEAPKALEEGGGGGL
jgi:hypothetical protein